MGFADKKQDSVEKKDKYKVDLETAEAEFNSWAEDWEIDTDVEDMDDEDKTDFNSQKLKLIKAMRFGRLEYDRDNETFKYTGKFKEGEVKIKMPNGAAMMAMDKYKDREGVHKTYAILAAMTGKSANYFSSLAGIDLKPYLAVVTLFLAS